MRRGRPGSVHSIEKAARILRALAEGGPQRLSDLSRRLRIPKTTLIAFVRTLVAERFVVVDGLGRYGLGPGLLELGQAFLDRVTLRDVARPYLERLAEATREVVHLTILSEGEMIYIDRIQTRSVVQVGSSIRGRAHLRPHGDRLRIHQRGGARVPHDPPGHRPDRSPRGGDGAGHFEGSGVREDSPRPRGRRRGTRAGRPHGPEGEGPRRGESPVTGGRCLVRDGKAPRERRDSRESGRERGPGCGREPRGVPRTARGGFL